MEIPDNRGQGTTPEPGRPETPQNQAVTISNLAEHLQLSEDLLRSFKVTDVIHDGAPAIAVPYLNEAGQPVGARLWTRIDQTSVGWQGEHLPLLYGQQFMWDIRRFGWVLIVQGEADTWAAASCAIPALGLPEGSAWHPEWATLLDGLQVFVWELAETAEMTPHLLEAGLDVKVVPPPADSTTLTACHLQGFDIAGLMDELTESLRVPFDAFRRDPELWRQAEPILYAADPLSSVADAIRGMGYGGAVWPIQVTYLAATSRLLRMRPGSMPVHLLLVGSPSSGKSYAIQQVLRLLPTNAYHIIEAGSPTVLIYEETDLRHRVLIVGEMDSLPAGEDSPVASAIRSLLQDHAIRYAVTIEFKVRRIDRPGPTVLITSGIHRFPEQLDSRVFTLEMPDDVDQIAAALEAQASLEVKPAIPPGSALVAFQGYLQARAPWDVRVPFAPDLARELRKNVPALRILRDFTRLISLVKAHALLSHTSRRTDHQGRVVATVDDYTAIYHLIDHVYSVTASGASERVRSVVRIVYDLYKLTGNPVTATDVAGQLHMAVSTASRHIHVAVKNGWLLNCDGNPQRFKLEPGDTVPPASGLPHPDVIRQAFEGET